MSLKGQFTQKWKFCHHLLTLKLFQTCLKNVEKNTLEVIGYHQLFGYKHPLNYLILFSTAERNLYRFGTTWGKWWQNLHFWMNDPFNMEEKVSFATWTENQDVLMLSGQDWNQTQSLGFAGLRGRVTNSPGSLVHSATPQRLTWRPAVRKLQHTNMDEHIL